jgi:hypothetical protein
MIVSLPFTAALRTGLHRTTRSRGPILLLYVVNVAAALPFALALRSILADGAAASLALAPFGDGFDAGLAGDFLRNGGRPIFGLLAAAGPAALLLLAVNAVLSGGILASVRDGDSPATLAVFLHACGTYAGRLLRLLVVGLAGGIIVFAALYAAGIALLDLLTRDASGEDVVLQTGAGVWTGILLVLWIGYACVEYARADLVVHDRTSIFRALREGAGFVLLHPLRASLPYMSALLVLACAGGIYWAVESALPSAGPFSIALLFLFQQFFMVSRMVVRFLLGATVAASVNGEHSLDSYFPGWEIDTAE